jgi:hypothetical protein
MEVTISNACYAIRAVKPFISLDVLKMIYFIMYIQ